MLNPTTCSPDTLQLWSYLPQFVQDNDAAGGYQFLTWLDGIGSQQQLIDNLCRDTPEAQGWSIVLDVSRCPTYALPWLAQFVGVRFTGTQMLSDAAMRSAILNKTGFARGSLAGIAASVRALLNGAVQIIERVNGVTGQPDPYQLIINYTDEDGNLTYGELQTEYPWYTSAGGTPNVSGSFPYYDDFPPPTVEDYNAEIAAFVPAGLVVTVNDVG